VSGKFNPLLAVAECSAVVAAAEAAMIPLLRRAASPAGTVQRAAADLAGAAVMLAHLRSPALPARLAARTGS
jgi:hypothetical protein